MDRIYEYNSDASYKPNGGSYLQLITAKDLYIQNVTVAEHDGGHSDSFQVKFPNVFTNYPLGAVRVMKNLWCSDKNLWCSDKNLSLLCEAVDQYALQWTKREMVQLSVLSSWKEMVKGQIEERISKLKQNFKQPTGKVLQNADVKACLSDLHNKYVFVPADKAPNNIIIICKRYYIETLIKELGLDNSSTTTGNSTYTPCQMSSEDIVNTHDTFMKSFGIELSDDDKRLPYLYWTPKLHKSPVKHRFIAGSSKCTTKQLSSLLTKILTVIKTGLEKYCSIKTSHTGVNNMWILKNSTNLLSSLGHLGVHKATSIQTFDFSTLYTSIPHDLLKSRMNNIINNAFKHKNGAT